MYGVFIAIVNIKILLGMLGAGFMGHATANGNMHDRMIDYDLSLIHI